MNFHILLQNILAENADSNAIIHQKELNSISTLTYKDVSDIAASFYNRIEGTIKKCSCIGLLMKPNIFIPSLLISLLKHQCGFIFLNPLVPNYAVVNKVKIKWVLSYEQESNVLLKEAELASTISLKNQDKITLWKLKSEPENNCQNILYVIQTSGTTGEPKIVKVEEYCIWSNINSLRRILKLSKEIIYCGTELTFDPSMIEIFLSLTTGSCLLLVSEKLKINPSLLLTVLFPKINILHEGVTFIQMVPSMFLRWKDKDLEFIFRKSTLKNIVLGGEKFPEQILDYYTSDSKVSLYNIYGITEISCWASMYKVELNCGEIQLGTPLDDTVFKVVNEDNSLILNGIGELYIGSKRRKCYINEESSENMQEVMFRSTGDLVKATNNEFYYIGRANNIIKRFGNKINLVNLEELISKTLNLNSKFIWLEDEQKLVLFIQTQYFDLATKNKIVDKITIKLLHTLPKESSPDFIELLPIFPLTKNGKIHYDGLKMIYLNNCNKLVEFRNPHETFNYLIRKYFGFNEEDCNNFEDLNFFDIGGNSILVVQFLSEYQDSLKMYSSELASVLFEKSLKECCSFLKTIKWTNKRPHFQEENKSKHVSNKCVNIKVKWKYSLKACVDGTPGLIESKFVAVGSFAHIFALLKLQDGSEIFNVVLSDAIETAPLYLKKHCTVIVACYDGKLYSLNAATGKIIWEYSSGNRIRNTPSLCSNKKFLMFGSYDKYVHCINAENGILIWKNYINESITCTNLLENELNWLAVATLSGSCLCLSEETGNIKWKYKAGYPIFGSPTSISNEKEYFIVWPNVQGELHCINCCNGERVWKYQAGGQIYSSLVKHENCLIFGCYDYNIYCVEYTHRICSTRYKISLDSPIFSTPCILQNLETSFIIVASIKGNVYLIDFNSAEVNGSFHLNNEIFSSPVCEGNNIIIGCRDNNVYSLNITMSDL